MLQALRQLLVRQFRLKVAVLIKENHLCGIDELISEVICHHDTV